MQTHKKSSHDSNHGNIVASSDQSVIQHQQHISIHHPLASTSADSNKINHFTNSYNDSSSPPSCSSPIEYKINNNQFHNVQQHQQQQHLQLQHPYVSNKPQIQFQPGAGSGPSPSMIQMMMSSAVDGNNSNKPLDYNKSAATALHDPTTSAAVLQLTRNNSVINSLKVAAAGPHHPAAQSAMLAHSAAAAASLYDPTHFHILRDNHKLSQFTRSGQEGDIPDNFSMGVDTYLMKHL